MNNINLQSIVDFIQNLYNTKEFLPLHEPRFIGNEKKYINETIDSTFVSSVGKYVTQFEEMQKGFKVTLYKKKLSTTQETKLSTKEKIILELKKDNSLTREALAQKTGVSANAIKQHLSKLKSDGILKRVGSTKSGYWEVLDGK